MNPLRTAFLPPIQGLAHVAMRWLNVGPDVLAAGAWRPAATLHTPAATTADGDVAMEDWDLLFGAVLARLSRAADGAPDGAWHDEPLQLRRTMRDCEAALQQLRRSIVHERARAQGRVRTLCEGWTELG